MTAISLDLKPLTQKLTHEQFYELCMANRDVAMERSPVGTLIIMSPVGGESGEKEADYIADLVIWNRQTQLGKVLSSSTIFKLPNGGDRSPDAAWVKLERWNGLTPEQRRKFPPLCPDFVLELRSESDRLKPLQDKMQEYLDSGLRLGWLINPQDKQIEIYRPDQSVEVISFPAKVSGEGVLPGFVLDVC
ncbi:MAG: Uma2 family endonuclease [Cyanobacteria bacterium P01_H01_bin.21]